MATLVLQAHPVEDSYNAAMLNAVISGQTNPRVVRLGHGDELCANALAGVTKFIAVYPTWWGSLPATMLAALEPVLGPWIDGNEPAATSPLAGVTNLTAVTSHGSSKLINIVQGEPGLNLWKRSVLPLCAPDATFHWQSIYGLDRCAEADRTDFLARLPHC